jgi:2-keto-4-pentenoate hydratase/2-oxohepta-3-ene-1,7-dioic acid hydratase in catechol pathway
MGVKTVDLSLRWIMLIANFEDVDGLAQGIGIVTDNGLIDFSRAYAAYQAVIGDFPQEYLSIVEMIEDGTFDRDLFDAVLEFIRESRLEVQVTVDEGYRLLAPIPRPPAIYAIGLNYPAHAIEHSGELPREPIFFAKAPTSVVGPEEPIVYKKSLTRVDPEAELAVVIGQYGSDIDEDEAADYIAGYTIINDVTARDMQTQDMAESKPWFRSKGIDTFCPMGPYIYIPDDKNEPVELDIELRVNGEVRQKDNTGNLTFTVPQLISYISQFMTLYPGDVIATGTPEGMKPVVPGDVVEIEIEKIGVLRNPVVKES